MQIEKHCLRLLNCDKMNSFGLMAMPETLLITKAFDQQLRALANKSQFLMQNDVHIHTQTDTQCNSNSYFNLLRKYQCIHAQCHKWIMWDFSIK